MPPVSPMSLLYFFVVSSPPHQPAQASLPKLRDVLFVGNPIYDGMSKEDARLEVLKHLPNLQKIDGDMVTPMDKEKALGITTD